jgi:hypothetical protein
VGAKYPKNTRVKVAEKWKKLKKFQKKEKI